MASNTGRRIVLNASLFVGISVAMVACGDPYPATTNITPQAYQTLPLATAPSAELVYMKFVPVNVHGEAVWVLKGGPELKQGIISDDTISFTATAPYTPPNGARFSTVRYEHFIERLLREYSIEIDEDWKDGSSLWYGQVVRNKQTITYNVLQTKEHTYLELRRF